MSLYRRTPKPGQPQNLTWHYKFQIPGCKPERKSTGTTIRRKAEQIEQAASSKALMIAKGVLMAEDVEVKAVPLSTLATRHIAFAKDDHPSSADDDVLIVNRFVELVGGGDTFVHTISRSTIDRWREKRRSAQTRKKTQVTRSAVNRELNVIRAMFRQAVDWGYITESPCKGIKDFKTGGESKPVRVLTADELEKAFAELPEPYNLFCEITYRTLARLREVTSLRCEHVTLDRLPNGHQIAKLTKRVKGGKWKTVRIPNALGAKLVARIASDEQINVFPDHQNSDSVSAEFTPMFRALGLRCSHHAFRHSGITRMLEAGVNPRAIQEHAGWSSLKQLQRYGHVLDQEFMRAVDSTEDYLQQARADRAAAVAMLNGGKGGAA